VRLVVADAPLLDAALAGGEALERVLGVRAAKGWDVFSRSLARTREQLADDPGAARWGTRLFVGDDPPALVGSGGFKGPPSDGAVELGYAIAPERQGRGLATAAVRELLREALADPSVHAVIAHTLPEQGPSPRVLEKAGFTFHGEVTDDQGRATWRFRILDGALPA
jgi:[ribosomal protein S5]-alanine N-acetyltransferase